MKGEDATKQLKVSQEKVLSDFHKEQEEKRLQALGIVVKKK